MTQHRPLPVLLLLSLLVLGAVGLGLSLGPVSIPPVEVARTAVAGLPGMNFLLDERAHGNGWDRIIWDIRAPAVLMALFIGLGLAVSGSAMQSLFRNPLADPFLIGISAGGGFGSVVGLLLSQRLGLSSSYMVSDSYLHGLFHMPDGYVLVIGFSFLFSMGAVLIATWVARTGGRTPVTLLLLAGVAISALLTALTQFIVYLTLENPTGFVVSMMGSVANSQWHEVVIVAAGTIGGAVVLWMYSGTLNVMSLGDHEAKGLGVNVERSKLIVLGAASLVAAIGIPFCGVIGFVGLFIPHIMRRFMGPDLRLLLPASALAGGLFLILADVVSRGLFQLLDRTMDTGIFGGTQIPLGIVTSLVGGIFFIYLLVLNRGGR